MFVFFSNRLGCLGSILVSLVLTLLLIAALRACNRPAGAATTAPPASEVMIVGVAHLAARHDVHNSTFTDSPLSPKRQAQIADVVARLARFRPTKVLIEAPMGDPKYARRYRDFLRGAYTLPANEAYQFGFKLAKRAGDATIYPVDTWGPSIIADDTPAGKRVDAYLIANLPRASAPETTRYLKRDDALERNGTYLDVLRYLNSDEAIRANAALYSVIDGMGRSTDQAGAAYVAQWYTRNCYIFANILSVVKPGDRVVVIFGQGHEYLLRDFVRLHPTLVNVNPLRYLN